jgi:hypothetical protein
MDTPEVMMQSLAIDATYLTNLQMASVELMKVQVLIHQISYVNALQIQYDYLNEYVNNWLYDLHDENFDTGYSTIVNEVTLIKLRLAMAEMEEMTASILVQLPNVVQPIR